ncbi:MAG: CRTAC1 family protein, partial [Planctomycetes bacterium]|nr:CRTAC1 family protein [Planctomycetota bacterium]
CGAAAADVDGDGRDDLLVTCIGPDRLLMNRGGTFEDASAASGIRADGWTTSAAFADLDSDGDLDIYVAGYLDFDFAAPPRHGERWTCLWKGAAVACGPRGLPPRADAAYRNRGDGTFEDATETWGFAAAAPRYGLAVLVADLAGDAGPDVYVANDAGPNHLFVRRGERFEEQGLFAGCACDADGVEQASMGVDAADLDGNGSLDLVVTNFEQEKNNVFLNDGRGRFFDRADHTGIGAASFMALSWGVGIHDFDCDGVLDIYVVNGHVYPQAAALVPPRYAQRDHFFRGEAPAGAAPAAGSPRFRECGAEVGLSRAHVGRGAAFGDLDNDGDVDVVVCHLNGVPSIYENRSPSAAKRLTLTLRQQGKNPQAIGARVEVHAGAIRRVVEVRRQGSFQSSSDPRIHIGLRAEAPAGEVRVRWPDGSRERFAIAAGGGAIAIEKGRGAAIAP